MAFTNDKQRKGFYASQGKNATQSLNRGTMSKLSQIKKQHDEDLKTVPDKVVTDSHKTLHDIEFSLAKKQADLRAKHYKHLAEKEQNIINKQEKKLKKVAMKEDAKVKKILAKEDFKKRLKEAKKPKLSPQEQALVDAHDKRVKERLQAIEKKRLKVRAGLLTGGKAFGKGLLAVGTAIVGTENVPKRRKKRR